MQTLRKCWALPIAAQYALGLLTLAITLGLRQLIGSPISGQPFSMLGLAVGVVALLFGLGPSIVVVVLSIGIAAAKYSAVKNVPILSGSELAGLVGPGIAVIGIALIVNMMRRVIDRHDRTLVLLRDEQEKMSFLLDSMTDGFVIVDRDWNTQYSNRPTGQRGAPDPDYLKQFLGAEFKGFRDRVERASKDARMEVRCQDRYYGLHAFPQADSILVYVQDLTDSQTLKEQQEQLFRLEREARQRVETEARQKDNFLLALSHELRTPLTSIVGWTEIIQSSQDRKVVDQGVAAISRAAKLQRDLIGQLLDLVATEQPAPDDDEIFDLSEAAEEAVRQVCDEAEERGHILLTAFAGEMLGMRGSSERTSKAIRLILANALRFTVDPGRIEVKTYLDDGAVAVDIKDYGIGIEAELLPRLFEGISAKEEMFTRMGQGLGTGLVIVRSIVDSLGGSISVTSQGAQQGATFSLRFPRVEVPDVPGLDRTQPVTGDLTTLTILLVDDDPNAREIIRHYLQDLNAHVVEASSARQAMAILANEPVRLVVSDIGMPQVSGLELAKMIRANASYSNVKLMALSAYQESVSSKLGRESGFDTILSKPVNRKDFVSRVLSLVSQ